MATKFWTLNQNNSGGDFIFDKKAGLTHRVIIEAKTVDEASARAQDAGVYYDGVSDGRDCGCCGDRWNEPYGDGESTPQVYGYPFKDWKKGATFGGWMEDGFEVCVHYLDGRKEWA